MKTQLPTDGVFLALHIRGASIPMPGEWVAVGPIQGFTDRLTGDFVPAFNVARAYREMPPRKAL